jgi:hypothetical protein
VGLSLIIAGNIAAPPERSLGFIVGSIRFRLAVAGSLHERRRLESEYNHDSPDGLGRYGIRESPRRR